jgi:hypothetical protein
MAVGFMAIMAILIGFGDSQMRTTPLPHYPNLAVSIAETSPSPSPAKLAEKEKAAEQNKPEEAQKPTPAREMSRRLRAPKRCVNESARRCRRDYESNANNGTTHWPGDTRTSRLTPQPMFRSASIQNTNG